jgi:hypothetical protein
MARKLTILDKVDLSAFLVVTLTHMVTVLATVAVAGLVVLGIVSNVMPLLTLASVAVASKVYLLVAMRLARRRRPRPAASRSPKAL